MSRIGKKLIVLPDKVKVTFDNSLVKVNGPLGELSQSIPSGIKVENIDGKISVMRSGESPKLRALHGLIRVLIANMVQGVTAKFSKSLDIQGLGFRASVEKNKLILQVGYTHPVEFPFPSGIDISAEKQTITVKGIDKQLVGETAARIRAIRPPDPYKGKGIRYSGEYVKRKVGKTAVATMGTKK
ncbi:MAG TPA: 50S ribosomal protein L6 [Elusimicrobia bacterium]|jgi:large subunit ribosomal protein L6|nr:50S ribosomal protein L6 [Elusimicrobiota bacterium]